MQNNKIKGYKMKNATAIANRKYECNIFLY